MANSEILGQIATLLPGDHREAFLSMVAQFQSVPEDDEYLQILEAIGFMTLLWKEVPEKIQKILEGANPVTETCQSLSSHVKTAVENAIPSHQDLRQIAQSLQEHQVALKQTLVLVEASRSTNRSPWLTVGVAFLLGFGACLACLHSDLGAKAESLLRPATHTQE